MPATLFLLGVFLISLAAGCGEPVIPPEEAFDLAALQGEVDRSLPAELQQKQEAIRETFELLNRGIEIDMLGEYQPNVRFQESFDEFYPAGAIDLARWNFDGPPAGDDVPVVMYFSISDDTDETSEVKRVYTVSGSAGKLTIRRKK